MAEVDEVLTSDGRDLTPEGDAATGTESTPPGGPESSPVLAGDAQDDDGRYIDTLFWPNPDGDGLVPTIEPQRFAGIPRGGLGTVTDTMIPASVIMQPTDPAMPLFPANPFRTLLLIRCIDTEDGTTDQPFQIASDKNLTYGSPIAPPSFRTNDGILRIRDYTGAVWVQCQNATHPVTVSGWSIGK